MEIAHKDLILIKEALDTKIASLALLEEGGEKLARYERLRDDIEALILQH